MSTFIVSDVWYVDELAWAKMVLASIDGGPQQQHRDPFVELCMPKPKTTPTVHTQTEQPPPTRPSAAKLVHTLFRPPVRS
jgi:hypothetical protein